MTIATISTPGKTGPGRFLDGFWFQSTPGPNVSELIELLTSAA